MELEELEEKAKLAARAFFSKAKSFNALELSLQKVDKQNEGIVTRDQCTFAINDATESQMKPEEVEAIVNYHDKQKKGFVAVGVITANIQQMAND